MDVSRELLFFFSLLGVFNGLLLAAYLLFGKRENRFSNIYLGLLLLALVVRIGKSVFFYFNANLSQEYILVGIVACAAIGPMTYFFVRSQLRNDKTFEWVSLLHLTPLIGLAVFGLFFVPYNADRSLWGSLIRGIYWQWIIYVLGSAATLVRHHYVRKEPLHQPRWTQSILVGIFFVWLAYYTNRYTSYIVGALTFSLVIYMMIWILVSELRVSSGQRKKRGKNGSPSEDPEAKALVTKLDEIMSAEALYQNPNLSMPELANRVGLSKHQFSQLINQGLGKNYAQLLNEYRIEAAKDMLKTRDYLTVEAIAYDCGFNSPSTFHAAFKKITGLTPAAYRSGRA